MTLPLLLHSSTRILKNTCLYTFYLCSLLFASSYAFSQEQHSIFSQSDAQSFCKDKPIWSAFDISPTACIDATLFCAQQPQFAHINTQQLSEPFYLCVFDQLGIDAS